MHQQLAAGVIGKVFFLISSLVCKVALDPITKTLRPVLGNQKLASAMKKQTM